MHFKAEMGEKPKQLDHECLKTVEMNIPLIPVQKISLSFGLQILTRGLNTAT